ncbi:MAG: ABC transporter ATP-binding protein [Myxococcales bacterium]|nr:ABC transporter ATP-binding protein [Myxococcales bacterium]
MAEPLLSIQGLRVDYEDITAVDDVSFSVEAGMVYGLIGPNGAGKTSIIRVIATLLQPTYGQVRVCDIDLVAEPLRALHHIGFMPDMPPLYEDLYVEEFLELFASAYGLSGATRRKRIDELIEKVQLGEKRRTPAGELSRGMKQRLFLAKTLLHDPKVLLLDEPASGLDPRARLELRDVIVELGREGKAVVVSSHILAEMADFCNSVGIMERGKMLLSGRIEDILKRLRPGLLLRVRLLVPDDRLGAQLAGFAGVSDVEIDGASATFKLVGDPDSAANLLKELIQKDFRVAEYREQTSNLQDIFLQVSTGRVS